MAALWAAMGDCAAIAAAVRQTSFRQRRGPSSSRVVGADIDADAGAGGGREPRRGPSILRAEKSFV
jgi:hypothetical protein